MLIWPIFAIAWGFLTEVTSESLAFPIIFNEMRKSEFQAFQTFEPMSKASSKTFEIMTLKITESFAIQELKVIRYLIIRWNKRAFSEGLARYFYQILHKKYNFFIVSAGDQTIDKTRINNKLLIRVKNDW